MLDSPHSGRVYPDDFGYACPFRWLEETEDRFVDEIFNAAPGLGLPLLSAQFPRCYIDANRAEDDIDPLLLSEPWPGAKPTARSALGVGLIRRLHKQNNPQPLYDRLLSHEEIHHRIESCYRPYHAALGALLDDTYAAFGTVFHLNCHSMPGLSGGSSTDIVLGDRDGTTCDPRLTRHAARLLKALGFRVAINRPYKGVELVRKFSDPARGYHSLQIELRRGLYMNEGSGEKIAGFYRLQRNMGEFLKQLIVFTKENAIDLAAD